MKTSQSTLPPPGDDSQRFVTIRELAKVLRVSREYVRQLALTGKLRAVNLPSRGSKKPNKCIIRFSRAEVDRFIEGLPAVCRK